MYAMKAKHLASLCITMGAIASLVLFLITNSAHAQSSADTNDSGSVNQSVYLGIRPATTPILLQGPNGTTKSISVINQNPPSLVEFLYYTANSLSGRCQWLQNYPTYSSQSIGCPYQITPVVPFTSTAIFQKGIAYPETFLPTNNGEFNFYNQSVSPQEKSLVNSIQTSHTATYEVLNSYSNYDYLTVPMTNCVHLSGTGPIKVVFMRGANTNIDINDFLWWVSDGIDNGFKALDPFKSYISQFSFYADLQLRNDAADLGSISTSLSDITTSQTVAQNFKTSSSCGGDGKIYIDYSPYLAYEGSFSLVGLGLVFMNPTRDATLASPLAKYPSFVMMHEIGHGFAGLWDEYVKSDNRYINALALSQRVAPWLYDPENCSSDPSWGFRSSADSKVYGSVTSIGCTYLHNSTYYTKGAVQLTKQGNFYRASDQDLMLGGALTDITKAKYNVVSCGYIISAIRGQTLARANAQTHWPECLNMAKAGTIISDGIPPPANPPVLSSIPNSSIKIGDTMTITGTGFSATSNSIKLVPKSPSGFIDLVKEKLAAVFGSVAEAQTSVSTYYVISDIPSDGSTLNFTFPADIPNGTYQIQVSALNSDWSNASTLTVSGSGATPGSGGVDTGGTSGDGGSTPPPAGSISATKTYTCPSGYTIDSTNSICNKPAVVQQGSTSFGANTSYSCPSGYILSGPTCSGSGAVFNATISYSCSQSGISPSYVNGVHLCVIPSGYVWSPASTATPKLTYTCPSGYLMDSSGTSCHQDVSPRNLYATASAGIVNLTWQAYPYKQVSSYSLERAPGGTTKFAVITTVSPFTQGGSSQYGAYNDTSVAIGQKYSYRVRSQFPDSSYSDYSGTAGVTATKISTPKIKAAPASASELNVSWADADSGITGYSLTDPSGNTSSFGKTIASTIASNLLPKTKYCYTVVASFRIDNSIQSPASSAGCGTTQTPKMALVTPSSLQLSSGSGLSVTNSNKAAHIASVDLYVGKSTTPFSTSKNISNIPFNGSGLANGKYKAYAIVHFDSGATFKTKSITVQVQNAVSQTSLNKTIVPDGNSADTDAIFTSPDGSQEDISIETGDTLGNSANTPINVTLPTQPVTTNPTQTPITQPTTPTTASPQLNPTVSTITGATQLTVGGEAKWLFSATDPQNSSMTYSMNWGDGSSPSTSAVPSFKHSYAAMGTYTITAIATNSSGLTGQNTLSVVVNNPVTTTQTTTSSNTTAPSGPASVTASAVDASSDKVGVWNVFGPGPGRANGNNPYDWHLSATISNASGKTLSYATVIMNGVREGWSSSASTNNAFGVQLYPLVFIAPGFTTTATDQTYAISSNPVTLDMYVQPEDAVGTTFRGATLTIGFSDGTSITTQIPAASIAIPAMTSSMVSKGNSTATIFNSIGNWFSVFNW